MKRRFKIPTLVAAGVVPLSSAHSALPPSDSTSRQDGQSTTLFDTFQGDHAFNLAAHGSHRSHGSHQSHGSHRSSGAAVPLAPPSSPNRNLNAVPPASILPSNPAISPSSQQFMEVVRDVQTALYVYGYYTGAIDGVVGPLTRTAIMRFQSDYNLQITGTITPELLDALHVVVQ